VSKLILLLGDQLFDQLPGMPTGIPIFMREDWGLASRTRHHKQKLVLFFSAMRHYASTLPLVDYSVISPNASQTFLQALTQKIQAEQVDQLYAYEPADDFFRREVLDHLPCKVTLISNPMFIVSGEEWFAYRGAQKRLMMRDFYIRQRQREQILVTESGGPVGGKWSFDAENRRKLPNNVFPPPVSVFQPDAITKAVIEEVVRLFPDHPGSLSTFAYPITRNEALIALQEFIDERFADFGEYEDAISQRERTVFHSVLSPCLNMGLLTPREVIDKCLESDAPLNSIEGFIRQILGWREFMFHIGREYEGNPLPNFLNNHRKLKSCWWDGTTGLPPLDCAIKRANEYGWCHHIERLMILGSVMLMCDISPTESYQWFMDMFVDSAEWVMLANVFGMSQFSDGGVFATKPYISGSNYILKMSDWKRGDWCETWDGLYWRFLLRHRETFAKNPRMTPMYGLLDRMDEEKRTRLLGRAEKFITLVSKN
jgi:deoxyribodipyrimidine photolyase-related protein